MATPAPLAQLSIVTTAEAEDAVAMLLERISGLTASAYVDEDTKVATVTVFLKKRVPEVRKLESALLAGLESLRALQLNLGEARIVVKRVPREDWAESWKKFFKNIEIGRALLIKPSWSKRKPYKNQAVVILDPGLSFGTGQHPTTHFCLEQVVAQRKDAQSLLDIGTGTGILAIAAAKLGYPVVRGFDFDPVAVRVAKANAKRNRVLEKLSLTRQDITKISPKGTAYDVVCANLMADLLIQERVKIGQRVKPAGHLVLAGILCTQFGAVQKAYAELGFRLIASRELNEWRSGLFQR